MAKKWKDVISSSAYKNWSPAERVEAQRQYFDQVVSPQIPDGEKDKARQQFYSQYPVGDPSSDVGGNEKQAGIAK